MAPRARSDDADRRAAGIESHSRTRHLAVRVSSWLLAAMLLLALFWQGGVSPAALAALFAAGALVWPFVWAVRPHRRPVSRFAWLWLALGTYTALLLVPLPRGLVAALHPRAAAISDAGRAALGLAPASSLPLALAPGETAFQAALYLLAGAFGLMLASVLTRPGWRDEARQLARLLVWPIAGSCVLWLLAWQPSVSAMVPHGVSQMLKEVVFVNANHQAAVGVVGLALGLGAAMDARNERVRGIYGFGAAGLGLVVLLTASRGGILAALFVLTLTGLTAPQPHPHMRREERERRQMKRQRALLAGLSVLIVLVVATLPVIEPEFEVATGASIFTDNKLVTMGRAFGLVGDGWLLGQGPGALPVVVGALFPDNASRVDFAENLVADRLMSGGLWGGVSFVLLLGWIVGSMVEFKRRQPGYTPLWIAVCALLLHELVDFSMEVGGGLLLFMTVATLAERARRRRRVRQRSSRHRGRRRGLLPRQVGAAFALGVGALLLAQSEGKLSRQVQETLSGLDAEQTAQRVAAGLLHHHHAWYQLARKLLDEDKPVQAERALDRALALRPGSEHARLFRFAVRAGRGDMSGAAEDLEKLLAAPRPIFEKAMAACVESGHAEALLQAVTPRVPQRSYDIGRYLFDRRPDLLERVALGLRIAHPERRYGIESLRALLYVRRGLYEPARRISAALMANPETELEGWEVEADVLRRTGRPYEAYHLFREVCDHRPQNQQACLGAIRAILAANRPKQALAYIRSRFPQMRSTPAWSAHYWRAMSAAYLQLERADDAIMAAERVLGFARNDWGARKLLLRARLMIGDRRGAARLLEGLLAEGPDAPDLPALSAAVSAAMAPVRLEP